MPKAAPHFDVGALLMHVQAQDVGLVVSTNDPHGLRRVLYEHMRVQPSRRCHVYAAPDSPRRFWLVKMPIEGMTEVKE